MSSQIDYHDYLPVNDDVMRWGIYVTGIGRGTVARGSAYPPARHPPLYGFRWERGRTLPEFAVVLVDQGQGIYESEATGLLPVPAASAMFLFPGVWHRYRPRKEVGWTERWLCFNGELAHRLMEMALLPRQSPIRRIAHPANLIVAFDELLEKVHRNPAGNSILLSLYALGYLAAVVEAATSDELPNALETAPRRYATRDAVVSQAMALIWTRGHRTISVDQIAESVGVTRRTLERRFHKSFGHTVVEEIIRSRLNRAKRLLQETEMSVKVVSQLSGFPSEERMRVAFVGHEGISPLRFRQLCCEDGYVATRRFTSKSTAFVEGVRSIGNRFTVIAQSHVEIGITVNKSRCSHTRRQNGENEEMRSASERVRVGRAQTGRGMGK